MNAVLPWHSATVERVLQLAAADKLPNALALTCAPGWGHEQLLSSVALQLLGLDYNRPVTEIAHADFRWIEPEGAVLKIDQVRRINDFAAQTSQVGGRKIAAIVDAHLFNTNAANALLKTLEEPPPNTHLLLATPYWGKLLPTIRSRCQRIQAAPDHAAARAWLTAQGVDLSDAEFAEYGYAPLTARDAHQVEQVDMTAWLCGLPASSLEDATAQVLDMDVVNWLARWYRRILLHLQGVQIPQCVSAAKSLLIFADQLLDIRRQIESSNAANSRLLVEQLIVRWVQMQRKQSK